MSYYPNHNMPPCGRPPQHPLTFGELNYTAEQVNALLGMIPFKADRAEVPEMEKLSDVNYVGHVSDPSLLTHQAQPSWAMVGDLRACRPYFYYVEGFVPQGYQPGWNDVSHVLGTYNLTENKVSIFDFSLVTEYNVSHNHTHLAKVFNQEWAAIPYRSYEKQFIAAKKYKKGDCVNMPEYTLYTFRATTDMQNIPPFVEQETNAFTFDEAIAVTPADYRIPGIKLTFINRMDGKAYTYFFRGKSADLWTDVQSWQIIDYAANDEVYRTNLFDRFISHEEIDGAEVTEADLKEVTAIIQAIQADKVVSFYYDPDKSSVTHFGTLDCYINETLSEFGCYISTVDGYFIARCNVRKPGKWSMIGLSSGGGGGTSPVSYNQLTERPSINNVLLTGNHTENELGIPSFNDLEQVNRTAETAKNAVATLEGLSNATTAMETLAGQVVQIEENKQNIVANKAEADAKLSELASEVNGKATKAELQAEVTRATNAENALSKSVQAETARATNAELELRKSINNETIRAKEAEKELENSVNANRYGYNVTVNGLKGGVHTIETAIKDVPSKFRMLGQKITFRTENGDWATYHNESLSLDNYENVNDWAQEVGISEVTGDVNITNAPDYEDLTEAKDGTIKFADKEYNKESFSGLGRVYLRKNIVEGIRHSVTIQVTSAPLYDGVLSITLNGVAYNIELVAETHNTISLVAEQIAKIADGRYNVSLDGSTITFVAKVLGEGLSTNINSASGVGLDVSENNEAVQINQLVQDIFVKPNTIYNIQYDYDLNGAEITIPEGCVLDFQGGSFSNGIIRGNNTIIDSDFYRIFENIELVGYWNVLEFNTTWFGIMPDMPSIDCTPIINMLVKLNIPIIFNAGNYYFSEFLLHNSNTDKVAIIGEQNYG